jgi:hypothetical protein
MVATTNRQKAYFTTLFKQFIVIFLNLMQISTTRFLYGGQVSQLPATTSLNQNRFFPQLNLLVQQYRFYPKILLLKIVLPQSAFH